MSFPERLTLGHLIDGENDKDAVTMKEYRAELTYRRNMDASSSDATAAAVDGDSGKCVVFVSTSCH